MTDEAACLVLAMALQIHQLEQRKAHRRKQRNRRRWKKRWENARPTFFVVLAVTVFVLCVTGPSLLRQLRERVNHTMLPVRMRQQVRQQLLQQRPIAEAYREEKLVTTDAGWLLKGDCLRQDEWHAYWVYDDGRTVVSPRGE